MEETANRPSLTSPLCNVVGEAASGHEALEKFRATRPDVTLMDVQMPEMSGIDAIIAIGVEYPTARIIVLTTYGDDALAERALKAACSRGWSERTCWKPSAWLTPVPSGSVRTSLHS
jgi:DNA-binding NarL/FixJ family response regulator